MNTAKLRIGASAALRRFKGYPAHQDYGVEWLGEIPAHWKTTEQLPDGDFHACSGPGTVRLTPEDAKAYIRTRFGAVGSTE